MFKLGKYEFDSLEQANSKIRGLGTERDEDGNDVATHPHSVVRLGFLVIEEGQYDEEGNVVKEAVYSNKYSVDAMWVDTESHPFGWKSYAIDVDGDGSHSFAGINFQENKI